MSLPDSSAPTIRAALEFAGRDVGTALRWYLLIEPMLDEPFAPSDLAARAVTRIRIRHATVREDQAPRLVALSGFDDPLLDLSIERALSEHAREGVAHSESKHALPFSIGGWFALADTNVERLARHLEALAIQIDPRGAQRYFRFADRRVIALAADLLRRDHLTLGFVDRVAKLAGPAALWLTLDHNAAPIVLKGHGTVRPEQVRHRLFGPNDWVRLYDAELINRTLAAWRESDGPLPARHIALAARGVARSAELGLETTQDRVFFAYCSVSVHSEFDRHPAVADLIERARGTTNSLVEVLGVLTPAQWAAIARWPGPSAPSTSAMHEEQAVPR